MSAAWMAIRALRLAGRGNRRPSAMRSGRSPSRIGMFAMERTLIRELKPLESVQCVLDTRLQVLARTAIGAIADPGPFLQQQLFVLPVRLQVDGGNDVL